MAWQAGRDQWHVDAGLAVAQGKVFVASAYLDAFQAGHIGSQFSLRTEVAPLSIAESVRRAAQEVVPRVSVDKVTTLTDQMDQSIVLERTIATLSQPISPPRSSATFVLGS